MSASPRITPRQKVPAEPSRLWPLSIAGAICFLVALVLGCTTWYFFGTHRREAAAVRPPLVQTPSVPTPDQTAATPEPSVKRAPAGELPVPGGEVALGGEGTDMPLRRELVSPFLIAETEVTNEQYREFVKATRHQSPQHWEREEYPPGTATEPVTRVTWQDAEAYCKWLSTQLGATVRLPTEAEWEFAARGASAARYPWGNEWKKEAARSEETGGKVSAVKSFALNRSPFGAFDMAGNVWEWTREKVAKTDAVIDPRVKKALENGQVLRVVKGGSAFEKSTEISAQSRYEIPENTRDAWVGFRYVIERKQTP